MVMFGNPVSENLLEHETVPVLRLENFFEKNDRVMFGVTFGRNKRCFLRIMMPVWKSIAENLRAVREP